MKATGDFTATLNGVEYTLRKGEEFKGDVRAERHLVNLGLLKQATERKKKTDER